MADGEDFYVEYFQEPGRAEAEIKEDVHEWLLGFYRSASRDAERVRHFARRTRKELEDKYAYPQSMPRWFTEADLSVYAAEFEYSGSHDGLAIQSGSSLNIELVSGTKAPIIFCASQVEHVDDALEIISAAFTHGSTRLLLHEERLPAAFFELRSRFAGDFVQKLVNYRISVAAVFWRSGATYSEHFSEYIAEARRGGQFRTFEREDAALQWLDGLAS